MKCIIAVGDSGQWCVLQRPKSTEDLCGLLECLVEDESEIYFEIDISPGVYEADYSFRFISPDDGEGEFQDFKLLWGLKDMVR